MAAQLKNTLSLNLVAGATVVLPHGLSNGQRALAPDHITIPPGVEVVSSDTTNVTLYNSGVETATGDVLVEAWHTFERAFGGVQNVDLPVKPYVVTSGATPSIPAFVAGPPRIVYADSTGNDTTGDGSSTSPFRTAQHAIDVGYGLWLQNPRSRVLVDVSGSSTAAAPEVFPANYIFPIIETAFGIEGAWPSPYAASYYPFTTMLGFDVIAKPELATLAQGLNTLAPANITSVTTDAATNLTIVTTDQDYGVADTLKGLLVQDGVGLRGVIWHNTAGPNSVIYLTVPQTADEFILPVFASPLTGFPPGNPPGFPVPFGGTLQIVERTAYWETSKEATNLIQGGFLMSGCGGVSLRGIDISIDPAQFNPSAYNLEIFRSSTVCIEGCKIDGLLAIHSPGQICVINSHIVDAVVASEIPLGFFSVLCENIPSFGLPWVTPTAFTAMGLVLDGCAALGPRYHPLQPIGRGPMMDLQLRSCLIMNSVPDLNSGVLAAPENFPAPFVPNSINPALALPGHGVILAGGHAYLDHVMIFGAAGDAIHVEGGGGFVELKSVTGGNGGAVFTDLVDTLNGGVGLLLTAGAHCLISDQVPNVSGTGDSFAVAGPVVTLTDAAGLFTPAMNGRPIIIAGATTPTNNGTFVLTFMNPNQVTYINAGGVAEAFPGTWRVVTNAVVTDVSGADGDTQVGDAPGGLAPTWVALHITKQAYDITAVAAGGATGTGSRLFEKP
jgi:hypothetical protein